MDRQPIDPHGLLMIMLGVGLIIVGLILQIVARFL